MTKQNADDAAKKKKMMEEEEMKAVVDVKVTTTTDNTGKVGGLPAEMKNPTGETNTATGGANVPVLNTPAANAGSLKTDNFADKAAADVANTTNTVSVPLQKIEADAKIVTTQTLHGGIDIGFTPKRGYSYFKWAEAPLADFSRPDELDDAIRERAIMDYPKWSKMPVDMKTRENPVDAGIPSFTDDTKAGVPVLKWIFDDLIRAEKSANIGLLRDASLAMDLDPPEDQYDAYENHLYYNDQVNVDLMTYFQADWESDLYPAIVLWRIYSQMNNLESTIIPLKPEDKDTRFVMVYHERTDESYNIIMDRSFWFRHMIIAMNGSLIGSYVPMSASGEAKTSDEVFKILRVKETVRDFSTEIPRNISSTKATMFYSALMNASLMSRWAGLYMEINFDDASAVTLLECLLLKLMVPYSVMHADTAIAVDNYLALYLIPRLPGFNTQLFIVPEIRECRSGQVNYLNAALDIQNIVNNYDATRAFLYTTGNGGGWNTTENCQHVGFEAGTEDFVNQRDMIYVPIGGIDNEMEYDAEFPQFTRMKAFVAYLVGQRFSTDKKAAIIKYAIMTLDGLVAGTVRAQSYAFYTNRVLKRLGLVAHTYPNPVDLSNPANAKPNISYEERINVQPGGVMSAIFLIDFEKTSSSLIGKDFLQMGWCVNHWFANLTEISQYVVESLQFRKWKRSDKVKKICEMMTANFTLSPALQQHIGSVPVLYDMIDIHIPSRAVHDMSDRKMTRGIRRLEAHIRENLIRYGVADHFFYDPRPGNRERVNIPFFQEHYQQVVPNNMISATLDWDQLVQLHVTETYQPLVERAQNEGKLIRYNIPIKLKEIEMPRISLVDIPTWNPIDYLPGNKILGIKTLPIYYFWKELYDERTDNFLAHPEKPRWVVDVMYPFVWRGKALDFEDFVGHRFTFRRDGFRIVDKFQFGNLL